jgi:hypothetical protein
MTTPPYPLLPEPTQKRWLDRHPLWKIPLGCLTLFLLLAVFVTVLFTVIMTSFRSSDVYKEAMARAAASSEVRTEIGEPIRATWLISGHLNVSGSTGNADLSIPISGPRGKAVIRAVASKSEGVWHFTVLQVNVEGHVESIDLLSIQPPTEP